MDIREAYGKWSEQYDTNKNRTRDLEAKALRDTLKNISFDRCWRSVAVRARIPFGWLNTQNTFVLQTSPWKCWLLPKEK